MALSNSDCQKLSMMRLEDSQLLLRAERYSGAYYLAGYAVELALKACIAKTFSAATIPEKDFVNKVYSHKLDGLANLAGLGQEAITKSKENPKFDENWTNACKWSEQSRYADSTETEARTMVDCVADEVNGVLQWLKQYW